LQGLSKESKAKKGIEKSLQGKAKARRSKAQGTPRDRQVKAKKALLGLRKGKANPNASPGKSKVIKSKAGHGKGKEIQAKTKGRLSEDKARQMQGNAKAKEVQDNAR
jgi:hypothetical protein